MTFDKDFPSLINKKAGFHNHKIQNMFFLEIIQENCLDKKRVEESIDKLKLWIDNVEYVKWSNVEDDLLEKIEELKKELFELP